MLRSIWPSLADVEQLLEAVGQHGHVVLQLGRGDLDDLPDGGGHLAQQRSQLLGVGHRVADLRHPGGVLLGQPAELGVGVTGVEPGGGSRQRDDVVVATAVSSPSSSLLQPARPTRAVTARTDATTQAPCNRTPRNSDSHHAPSASVAALCAVSLGAWPERASSSAWARVFHDRVAHLIRSGELHHARGGPRGRPA